METRTYPIPVKDYYRQLLDILDFIHPFDKLRPRQKDIYAELLKKNNKYKSLDPKDRNKLIFDKSTYKEIAATLDLSSSNIYNIMGELKDLGLIISTEDNENIMEDKYIPPKVDIIAFKLIEDKN